MHGKNVPKPGIKKGIDSSSMPHVLAISADGASFSLITAGNVDRSVGDDVTNPMPSFVGTYINDVFFYLNRVGYLSNDNIFMSQPLVPDNVNTNVIQKPNYFINSAISPSAADPVDLNAASIRPVELVNALPAYNGLALFSQTEQFVLYSEQGVVTPQTAIVKSISNYEMNSLVDAIEVGDTFVFLSKTQRNTRVFELQMQGIDREPVLTDIGKVITDYIPNNVDALYSNPQNQFIALTSTDDSKMYLFRKFVEQGEIRFQAWFRYDMPGNIQTCAFFDDRMFVTMEAGTKTVVASAALNLVPEEDILTNKPFPDGQVSGSGQGIGPYLDLWISDGTPEKFTISYDTVTSSDGNYAENLKFTFPSGYPQISTLEPCVVKTEDKLTRSTRSLTAADTGYSPKVTVNDDGTWSIAGKYDLTDVNSWVAGYRFNYDLHIPVTYYRSETGYDKTAFLNIDRYKFMFNEASEVTFKLKALGTHDPYSSSDNWTDIKPAANAGFYKDNTFPFVQEAIFMLPIHRRNTFFRLRIFDNSPFPCTLDSMSWEGFYNPRFYRRT